MSNQHSNGPRHAGWSRRRWIFIGGVSAATAILGAAAYGCSSSQPPELGDEPGKPDTGITVPGPCKDGEVQACHVPQGTHDGVVSCFEGVQTCTAGTWGDCTTPSTGAQFRSFKLQQNGDLTTNGGLSVGANPVPSPCVNNPCDPTCEQFPNDGGTIAAAEAGLLDGGGQVQWFGVIFGPSGAINPSFAGGGMHDCVYGNASCNTYVNGKWAACQFDTYCNGGNSCGTTDAGTVADAGNCLQYGGGQTIPKTQCPGYDLTAGVGCIPPDAGSCTSANPGGCFQVPICNRGNTAIPSGTVIPLSFSGGNGVKWPVPPPCAKQTVDCAFALTKDLPPGQCVDITQYTPGAGGYSACGNNVGSGNAILYVNSNQSVLECQLPDGGYLPNDAGKAGCDDNWTDLHQALTCVVITATGYGTATYQTQYVASCPSGTHVQWSKLAYQATIPTNASGSSDILFEVQTAPIQVDGGTGTFTAWATAADPGKIAGDPASCPLSGPSPCPKDLYTILGGPPGATNEVLNLRLTLNPTPDLQAAPSANSWNITYSCPPSE